MNHYYESFDGKISADWTGTKRDLVEWDRNFLRQVSGLFELNYWSVFGHFVNRLHVQK